jgi:hypothetical protein
MNITITLWEYIGVIGFYLSAAVIEKVMVKVKTSVAIDSELVKWIDRLIKSKRFANRSHAVEFALKQLQQSYEKEGKF